MNGPTILAAALLWATMCPIVSQAAESVDKQEVKKLDWQLYLLELPEELDCHFTIERMGFRAGIPRKIRKKDPSPFHRYDLTLDPNINTVQALVEKLRREMRGIAVIQDTKKPLVIHLVEERLLKIQDYVMDKTVSITYSGLIDKLAAELGKHVPGIESRRGGYIGQAMGDFHTQVEVDAKNQTVREVLTHCVPLKDYSRVLWDTSTWKKKDGQYKTSVQYHGPVRLPPKK